MADHMSEPLIRFEDLFRPVEPPPVDLDRPVCKRTHEALLHSLSVLEITVGQIRKSIEMMPRHDVFIDGLRGNLTDALGKAGEAYALFMETRDCEGEA